MDSAQLCEHFGQASVDWKPFDEATVSKLVGSPGVYVIRVAAGEKVGRFKGESDIVYIGSSSNTAQRLAEHLRSREDLKDRDWHLAMMLQHKALEFAIFPCDDEGEAREAKLLEDYFVSHLELPPANLKPPELSPEGKALVQIMGLSPEQQRSVLIEAENRVRNRTQ